MEDSGTKKWCPKCKTIRVVQAVKPSSLGETSGQRFYKRGHEDIQFFRRGQQCQTCYECWLSAEVPESFIDELVKLRVALRDIKKAAEVYGKDSEIAAESLARLSKSLSNFSALE